MPKAEAGSTKWLSNKMKSKGLQRLRWYCQVCEKQCRDENGFKQHTMSEGHVRNMQLVGENSKQFIRDFSQQFKHDFLQLLRTAHGEKKVHANHFYQEYINNKEHVHMNATQWPSLTEFVKHLGREGICRVSEEEKGVFISWVDDSPEALRRRDAIRKRERQDKGDEEREQRMLMEQVERAREKARLKENEQAEQTSEEERKLLERKEGEKISLSLFGKKAIMPSTAAPPSSAPDSHLTIQVSPTDEPSVESQALALVPSETSAEPQVETPMALTAPTPAPTKFSFSANKPKNVFAAGKKNPLAQKKTFMPEPAKKMSEAERIMREEMERKREIEERGGNRKRMKFN